MSRRSHVRLIFQTLERNGYPDYFVDRSDEIDRKCHDILDEILTAIRSMNWKAFCRKYIPYVNQIIDEARNQNILNLFVEHDGVWHTNFPYKLHGIPMESDTSFILIFQSVTTPASENPKAVLKEMGNLSPVFQEDNIATNSSDMAEKPTDKSLHEMKKFMEKSLMEHFDSKMTQFQESMKKKFEEELESANRQNGRFYSMHNEMKNQFERKIEQLEIQIKESQKTSFDRNVESIDTLKTDIAYLKRISDQTTENSLKRLKEEVFAQMHQFSSRIKNFEALLEISKEASGPDLIRRIGDLVRVVVQEEMNKQPKLAEQKKFLDSKMKEFQQLHNNMKKTLDKKSSELSSIEDSLDKKMRQNEKDVKKFENELKVKTESSKQSVDQKMDALTKKLEIKMNDKLALLETKIEVIENCLLSVKTNFNENLEKRIEELVGKNVLEQMENRPEASDQSDLKEKLVILETELKTAREHLKKNSDDVQYLENYFKDEKNYQKDTMNIIIDNNIGSLKENIDGQLSQLEAKLDLFHDQLGKQKLWKDTDRENVESMIREQVQKELAWQTSSLNSASNSTPTSSNQVPDSSSIEIIQEQHEPNVEISGTPEPVLAIIDEEEEMRIRQEEFQRQLDEQNRVNEERLRAIRERRNQMNRAAEEELRNLAQNIHRNGAGRYSFH